ncbi:nucleotide pyrophosphohydrolase [Ramlibacter sp. AN1015]|uniref:nucleotide pyrophosphohydrolase n=1 Tax=Ramlibacter sp. AN1015 TaxID=3133428 RepID=UPI0030C1FDB1
MSDSKASPLLEVGPLQAELRRFAEDRDWEQFHSPKNLVMALTGELGELAELFQWSTEDESRRAASDPRTASAVRDEIADVTLYLVRLADVLGVDLDAAVKAKLALNAAKYPAERFRGSSRKSSEGRAE